MIFFDRILDFFPCEILCYLIKKEMGYSLTPHLNKLKTVILPLKGHQSKLNSYFRASQYRSLCHAADIVCLSSTIRLFHRRVPRLTSDNFKCCHTKGRAGKTTISVSAGHIILAIKFLSFTHKTFCCVP